ncbi:DUF2867 domain-containing protein [Heliorestis convoluta]|uniref:DUF2867 domain-containing protein n=1 Tax=Heliorestis convoluta TaxID=356322 RepID=A0A5Q2N7Q1_9FIRM|nr:DUF2867 domain-containing protein [Heliorestis convoluta]QGG49442.1 hypothetical protein FTV88_3377 [Heliorestis convoluta]
MSKIIVEEVALPVDSVLKESLERVDYVDAYRIPWPEGVEKDVVALIDGLFTSAPAWTTALTEFRNRVVPYFGIKVPESNSQMRAADFDFTPGSKGSFFRVYEREEDEIVVGDDDRHLNFRISFMLDREESNSLKQEDAKVWAVVSTAVQFHNWLGKAYFLPVRPFHRRMVPAMLKSLASKSRVKKA